MQTLRGTSSVPVASTLPSSKYIDDMETLPGSIWGKT
jgi:hypothetical protein